MISTPMKEGTMDKQHLTLIGDKDSPKHLIFPDMNAKFLHEQTKENTMDLSPEHRQHSTSPDIEMGIGIDCKKVDDGKVNGKKKKRTRCNCPNCVKRVSKSHMENTHQHICHICSKTYGKTSHLRVHLRVHEENKPFACDWHLCTWRFYRSEDLQRHRLKHTGEKRFECAQCGKHFMRTDHLTRHVRTHITRQYKQQTSSIETLKRHRLKHTGEKRFKCEKCDKRFMRSKYLRAHLLIHKGNKPFACDWSYCQFRFYRMADLRRHRLKHTGEKRHKCEQCGKRFGPTADFTRHLRTHMGPKQDKSHLPVHEGDKPFACDWPLCPWRFLRLSDLRRHRLKHTGEKRFKCEQCGKRFSRSDQFTGHVRKHNDSSQQPTIQRCSSQDLGKI